MEHKKQPGSLYQSLTNTDKIQLSCNPYKTSAVTVENVPVIAVYGRSRQSTTAGLCDCNTCESG